MTTAAAGSAPASPVERLTLLDALRGFALIGILTMNAMVLSGLIFMPPEALAALPTAAFDMPMMGLLTWLAYGKFYTIFSLLFGIGFALQMDAALRRGDTRLSLFKRRLAVLLVIGLVHLYFWEGDILVLYALMGFALIPFRHASNRALLVSAVVLVLAPVVLAALIALTNGAANPGAPLWAWGERVTVSLGFAADAMPYPTLRDAGWGEYLRFQLAGVFFRYSELFTTGRPFKVLAMFALGLWVGRSGLLRDPAALRPVLRRVRTWGLAVGLPGALVHLILFVDGQPVDSWAAVAEAAAYAVGVAPLGLAYAALFALVWYRSPSATRLSVLAPAGRMALTNYLMQTVLQLAIFYGIGFGLMGRFGGVWLPPFVAAVIALQVIYSRWWLARFQFGPFEWLWRQATYGRRLPLRAPAGARLA